MIRKPNWKYALGELTLIFLGVSLAVWFNNWNDNRKRDQLEKDILFQIYKDVAANEADVNLDYIRLQFGLESHLNITEYIEEDRPYADSMCFDFHWLKKDEYTFPIKAGYENLKAVGLDLVKNDSILRLIQAIFESGYPRTSRDTPFYPDLDEYYTEFYQQHFVPNRNMKLTLQKKRENFSANFPYLNKVAGLIFPVQIGYVPKDFEALKKNSEFQVMLRQSLDYRTYKLRQYEGVKSMSEALLGLIEQELGVEFLGAEEEQL